MSTLEAFLDNLHQSGLLAENHFRQIRQNVLSREEPIKPNKLAKWLVEQKLITSWHAEELLAGRHHFVLTGRYKLLDRVGGGASGTVYKAEEIGTGNIYAVKVLTEDLSKKPEALDRFRQETRMASALDHGHIIRAFESASDGDMHFLVMEYMEGKDLNAWLKQHGGPLPIDWACECIRQSALGLEHAHQLGMIHRDIKPGNLLVQSNDVFTKPKVKLLDMGFARKVNDDGVRLTQSWQIFGTPDYMSPEQAESTADADIRSDVYGLGCTLFKLLTGELPFTGSTPVQKLLARANHDAPRVRSKREDIPADLDEVVAKMLARSAEDRYQTPLEVAHALAPFAMEPEAAEAALAHQQSMGSSIGAREPQSVGVGARQFEPPTGEDRTEAPTMMDVSMEDSELVNRDEFGGPSSLNEPEDIMEDMMGAGEAEAPPRPDSNGEAAPATAPSPEETAPQPAGQESQWSSTAKKLPPEVRALTLDPAEIRNAAIVGMAIGGVAGALVGAIIGIAVGLLAPGNPLPIVACTVLGISLGSTYWAIMATANVICNPPKRKKR